MYVILLLLFRLLMFPGAVCAEILSLPDSLITDDNVYKYTFSDFDKAQQVMEQLRKRKSLSMFRMDVVEGDLYFNVGQYYKALKFYKRALDSDSVRNNDKNYMEQVHRMISCYDCLHNENKKSLYVYLLLKRAEQCGDKAMQSVALFNMGKMLYYQGNKEKGYEYLEQAIEMMSKTDYRYKYDNLRYDYNTLLIFQKSDRRNEEALRTLAALEKVVTEETGSETPMEGLSAKEKKAMANYEIIKKIAVLGGKPDGVTKEINIVKWGVYDPMIDIRRWQGDIASKGISLKQEEAQKLLDALKIVLGETEA